MIDTSQLSYFLGASILLTLAPGPDIIFVITQGISRGKKAAVLTALGLCSGITVHTTAAAFGVSAIFHTSAMAFQILKYAGAVYLLFLAWKTIKEKGTFLQTDASAQPDGFALFRRGIIMNLLNPKVSLFFLAFLPQFGSPDSGPIAFQMILLGLIFMIQAIVIFCTVGTFSGSFGHHLLRQPKTSKYLGWVSAGILAGLGIRLALVER
jgi:threonine/homoserine/homoserine lactone efflux protein